MQLKPSEFGILRTALLFLTITVPLSAWQGVAIAPPGSTGETRLVGVRAGCTPDSMAVARAGSLAAQELGRWKCMATNQTNTKQVISLVSFSLDFMELHQVDSADVADIFNMKQKMSKAGKIARGFEVVGVAAGVGLGIGGLGTAIKLSVQLVGAIGAATYGAGKLGDYFNRQIPASTNALAGQWGPADQVVLLPGQGIAWKVYASKMHGAKELGPRILTPVVQ